MIRSYAILSSVLVAALASHGSPQKCTVLAGKADCFTIPNLNPLDNGSIQYAQGTQLDVACPDPALNATTDWYFALAGNCFISAALLGCKVPDVATFCSHASGSTSAAGGRISVPTASTISSRQNDPMLCEIYQPESCFTVSDEETFIPAGVHEFTCKIPLAEDLLLLYLQTEQCAMDHKVLDCIGSTSGLHECTLVEALPPGFSKGSISEAVRTVKTSASTPLDEPLTCVNIHPTECGGATGVKLLHFAHREYPCKVTLGNPGVGLWHPNEACAVDSNQLVCHGEESDLRECTPDEISHPGLTKETSPTVFDAVNYPVEARQTHQFPKVVNDWPEPSETVRVTIEISQSTKLDASVAALVIACVFGLILFVSAEA